MKGKLWKFISRKLFVVVLGTAAAYFWPPLLPLLVKVVPLYVTVQGIVDSVTAYKQPAQ